MSEPENNLEKALAENGAFDPDKAEAVDNNGLLQVDVPYRDAMHDATEIKIG